MRPAQIFKLICKLFQAEGAANLNAFPPNSVRTTGTDGRKKIPGTEGYTYLHVIFTDVCLKI